MEELERVPEPGDRLEVGDVILTVLEDGQRVQVTLMPRQNEEED
jgi:hypothetical protein